MSPQRTTLSKTRFITIASILTAVAILIPMVMPIKVVVPPASYTLASHVPVMMAMFVSPALAAVVALGSALGFQLAGFPIIIVMRALSHVIFAFIGAKMLENHPHWLVSVGRHLSYSFIINLMHAVGEMIVVYAFMAMGSSQSDNTMYIIFVLVGLGTLIHGMVDFLLSLYLTKALPHRTRAAIFPAVL